MKLTLKNIKKNDVFKYKYKDDVQEGTFLTYCLDRFVDEDGLEQLKCMDFYLFENNYDAILQTMVTFILDDEYKHVLDCFSDVEKVCEFEVEHGFVIPSQIRNSFYEKYPEYKV